MAIILKELVINSAIGTALWLTLFCLRPLTQHLFSQSWHYYTGLIPLTFLLGMPRAVSSLIQLVHTLSQRKPISVDIPKAAVKTTVPALSPLVLSENQFFFNVDTIVQAVEKSATTVNVKLETLIPFMFITWATGCAAFLLWKGAVYIRFKHKILRDDISAKSIGYPLSVVISPNIATPMLIGVIKPLIVLPNRQYNEQELALIMAHETTHWKRGDMFIKFAMLCANAANWFNPFAYMINKDSINLCETACDEQLARCMSRSERIMYSEMILSTAEYGACRRPALSAGLSAGKDLKRRLMYILKYKKTKLPVMALSIAMSLMLTVSGGVMAYAAESVSAVANNKNNTFAASDYIVQEGNYKLPEGIEIIPNALGMYEAADIAAKALTKFFKLDLNGETFYMTYKEPTNVHFAMNGEEKNPNSAIMSSEKWNAAVFESESEWGNGTSRKYRLVIVADFLFNRK